MLYCVEMNCEEVRYQLELDQQSRLIIIIEYERSERWNNV